MDNYMDTSAVVSIKEEPELEVPIEDDATRSSFVCLFCLQSCPTDTPRFPSEVLGATHCDALQIHLQHFFILQKLLDIQSRWLQTTLEASGIEIQAWFKICTDCFELVSDAWQLYQRSLEIKSKIKSIKERIKGKMKESDHRTFVGTEVSRKIRELSLKQGPRNVEITHDTIEEGFTGGVGNASGYCEDVVENDAPISPEFLVGLEDDLLSGNDSDESWVSSGRKRKLRREKRRSTKMDSNQSSEAEAPPKKRKRIWKPRWNRIKFPWRCEYCPAKYKQEGELKDHKEAHKQSTEYKCKECNYPCGGEQELEEHVQKHLRNRKRLTCKLCDFKTRSVIRFGQHVKEEHSNLPAKECGLVEVECDKCSQIFGCKRDLILHKAKMHKVKRIKKRTWKRKLVYPWICPICPEKFKEERELHSHKETHEKSNQEESKFNCPDCKYPCFTEEELEDHRDRRHVPENRKKYYHCKLCEFKTRTYYKLENHAKQKHSGIPEEDCGLESLQCPQCHQRMGNRSALVVHKRKMHPELFGAVAEEGMECLECGEKFTSEIRLQYHQNKHKKAKKISYFCEICGKGFQWVSRLNSHMRIHSSTKAYVCEICGIDYFYNFGLKKHYRLHHPEVHVGNVGSPPHSQPPKPDTVDSESDPLQVEFICKVCGIKMPFALRNRHLKTHTDTSGFQCDICMKTYANLHGLKRHKRINHSNETAKCPYCFKSFMHQEYVKMHFKYCKLKDAAAAAAGNEDFTPRSISKTVSLEPPSSSDNPKPSIIANDKSASPKGEHVYDIVKEQDDITIDHHDPILKTEPEALPSNQY